MNIVEISNDFCLNYLSCMRRVASSLNITQSQVLCLSAIPFRGISQSNLAKKLSIDISTLSRNLNKLSDNDLINKKLSNTDKRSYKIKLTNKGDDLYKKFINSLSKEIQCIYAKLNMGEIDQIEEILNKLNWQLEILNR